MYHCGPTVYWNQHIGNLRSATIGDLIRRTFELNGYQTTYMRNYTDVGHLTGDNIGDADSGEDRMAKGAAREGLTPDQIADKYIAAFESDIAEMNILPPTIKARATHHIGEMISMVQTLLEKGIAYTTPLAIYLDISKVPEYNKLSKQDISKLLTGSGHAEVSDEAKKNPGDFSIWFFKAGTHSNALQTWESPFSSPLVENGRGFPGWHLECSAMIHEMLGTTIDIHIGGIEHIPIHHTNEIAQSECCFDEPLAKYWLHNEHLLVDGKKMSKSEGTSYLLSDIIEKGFDPIVLRYFFLQAHYRSQQNFTWEALTAAQSSLYNLRRKIQDFPEVNNPVYDNEILENFSFGINNDFNIPLGLACLHQYLQDADITDIRVIPTVLKMDKVLGLDLLKVTEEPKEYTVNDFINQKPVYELAKKRADARDSKDWKLSDELRDRLLNEHGLTVKDTAEGQIFYSN